MGQGEGEARRREDSSEGDGGKGRGSCLANGHHNRDQTRVDVLDSRHDLGSVLEDLVEGWDVRHFDGGGLDQGKARGRDGDRRVL